MSKRCLTCSGSDRPGYIVFARYYDRMVETDVIGERRLTSGVDYVRCMTCRGTGQASSEEEDHAP